MTPKTRTCALALCVAFLALASSPVSANAAPEGVWMLRAGEVLEPDGPLTITADVIDVAGAIVAQATAGDGGIIELVAWERITVSGTIIGADGASFGSIDGLTGQDGGDGSSIILRAPVIEVLSGANLQPGRGGDGGSAIPTSGAEGAVVVGGNGGNGGWLVLLGEVTSLPGLGDAWLGNAMGGNGGAAIASAIDGDASAFGGDGGHFGTIITSDPDAGDVLGDRASLPASFVIKPDLALLEVHFGSALLQRLLRGSLCSVQECLPPVELPDAVTSLIEGEGACDGTDGAPAEKNGKSWEGGAAPNGAPGLSLVVVGLPGERGYDGTGAGTNGGYAKAGDGTDGCWAGKGGNGGNADANGGNGQTGGEGGTGGSGAYAGGNGGIGGNGGPAGNGGEAIGGRPGCGGWLGKPGAPGTASAVGGVSNGGQGGRGGNGQVPGTHGTAGAVSTGAPGTMKTQPDCVNN